MDSEKISAEVLPFWDRVRELAASSEAQPPFASILLMSEDQPRRAYILAITQDYIELAPPQDIVEEVPEEERLYNFGLGHRHLEGDPVEGAELRLILRPEEIRGIEFVQRRARNHPR